METPRTAGEMLAALRERFGTDELHDLARASGIGRSTLDLWSGHQESPLRKSGRDHYRRIFGEHAPPRPGDAPDLAARLDRIESLLHDLLLIGGQGRLPTVLKAKAKHKGGGAA